MIENNTLGLLLLFIITVTIIVYFVWNAINNNKIGYRKWQRQNDDIRYYELKSKYEFLVAVSTLLISVAVFYGYSTKKDLEESLKKDFDTKLTVANKNLLDVMKKVGRLDTNVDARLKQTSTTLDAYYDAFKQIEQRQNQITQLSKKSEGKFNEVTGKITALNKANILKRNFYLVNNITINYDEYSLIESHSVAYSFKNLTTTLGDKLPTFNNPPIIIAVSNNGFVIQIFDVTVEGFKVRIVPEYAQVPKDGIIVVKLLISETQL